MNVPMKHKSNKNQSNDIFFPLRDEDFQLNPDIQMHKLIFA